MKTTNSLRIIALVMIVSAGFSVPVHARIKCWTNSEGVRECGTSVPPEYAQKQHQELSKQGTLLKKQERAKTEEELKEEERLAAIEAEKKKQAEEQARKDKILLDTFSTVDDIEMARNGKLAAIDSRIKLTRKHIGKIQEDLDKRIKAAAAAERSGKAPNKALLQDIESLRRQIKNNQGFIEERRKEQKAIKQAYNADIERFKRLKAANNE
ncbi:MAG: hypothetical protein ACE5GZ_03495 [Gammaproteobacteria bacterium]